MPEHFCLKWSDFHSSIVTALDSLKCSEDLVDVTLTCEGQNIKAHKVVLSACSPYFREVFKENPCQHPIIILKDVLAADMTRLLAYMYQGEVTVLEEQLHAFLQTAELLKVSGLTPHVIQSVNQMKQKSKPMVPPLHNVQQKKSTVHPVSVLKKPTSSISLLKDPAHIPVLKTYQPRKKRSSSSDPVDLAPLDQSKKSKVSKDKPSVAAPKVIESTSSLDHTKSDTEKNQNNNEPGNKSDGFQDSEGLLPDVKVKQEVEELSNDETEESAQEETEAADPKPFYETSMLARSLMSGTQSIKNDSLANPVLPVSKSATHSVPEVPPVEIKTESLSPSQGIEPEVVISEEENRTVALVGTNLPANHAAICGKCPHCGTQYYNQSALKYHVRLMHSDLTNRLCCYLCPRSFTVRDTYKEHMWTFHGQRN